MPILTSKQKQQELLRYKKYAKCLHKSIWYVRSNVTWPKSTEKIQYPCFLYMFEFFVVKYKIYLKKFCVSKDSRTSHQTIILITLTESKYITNISINMVRMYLISIFNHNNLISINVNYERLELLTSGAMIIMALEYEIWHQHSVLDGFIFLVRCIDL